VRQPGESSAGTRGASIAGDRDLRGNRRHTVANRAATVDREPAARVRRVGPGRRIFMAVAETLVVASCECVALLAPEDGPPPARNSCCRRAADDGTVRPGARTVCLASRDRRWTERRRT